LHQRDCLRWTQGKNDVAVQVAAAQEWAYAPACASASAARALQMPARTRALWKLSIAVFGAGVDRAS